VASPNFLTANYIYGRTEHAELSAEGAWFADNPSASGAIKKVTGLFVANTGTAAGTFSVSIIRNEVAMPLVPAATVGAGLTAVVIDESTSLFIEDNDYLLVSGPDFLAATCVYQEMGTG
jgi:hypothetical protein